MPSLHLFAIVLLLAFFDEVNRAVLEKRLHDIAATLRLLVWLIVAGVAVSLVLFLLMGTVIAI